MRMCAFESGNRQIPKYCVFWLNGFAGALNFILRGAPRAPCCRPASPSQGTAAHRPSADVAGPRRARSPWACRPLPWLCARARCGVLYCTALKQRLGVPALGSRRLAAHGLFTLSSVMSSTEPSSPRGLSEISLKPRLLRVSRLY